MWLLLMIVGVVASLGLLLARIGFRLNSAWREVVVYREGLGVEAVRDVRAGRLPEARAQVIAAKGALDSAYRRLLWEIPFYRANNELRSQELLSGAGGMLDARATIEHTAIHDRMVMTAGPRLPDMTDPIALHRYKGRWPLDVVMAWLPKPAKGVYSAVMLRPVVGKAREDADRLIARLDQAISDAPSNTRQLKLPSRMVALWELRNALTHIISAEGDLKAARSGLFAEVIGTRDVERREALLFQATEDVRVALRSIAIASEQHPWIAAVEVDIPDFVDPVVSLGIERRYLRWLFLVLGPKTLGRLYRFRSVRTEITTLMVSVEEAREVVADALSRLDHLRFAEVEQYAAK